MRIYEGVILSACDRTRCRPTLSVLIGTATLPLFVVVRNLVLRLARSSLDWALLHAEAHGDTDILPIPFEYAAIRHDWARIAPLLTQQDVHGFVVRPHRRFMTPKARHGFRVVTQLDPIDLLLFTGL